MKPPAPTLSATITSTGAVVIHGDRQWTVRLRRKVSQRRACHCSVCGAIGHCSRNKICPGTDKSIAETKAILKARRT